MFLVDVTFCWKAPSSFNVLLKTQGLPEPRLSLGQARLFVGEEGGSLLGRAGEKGGSWHSGSFR